jgi:hypothetical protein
MGSPGTRSISAPFAAIRASFGSAADSGTNTLAGTPRSDAARATAAPWFPVDAATTPLARSASGIVRSLFSAPRNLNEPVTWSVSSFRRTPVPSSTPSHDASTRGVSRAWGRIRASAARASATRST